MTPRLTLGSTRLEYGYFYHFWPNRSVDAGDDWVVSDDAGSDPYSRCEVVESERKEVQRFKCKLNARHGLKKETSNYVLDITYIGMKFGAIIPNIDHVVVTRSFATQLESSGLKGWRILPCRIRDNPEWFVDEKTHPLPKLYQLAFDGLLPYLRRHIEPPSSDRCPHCGKGPIVCPDCGHCSNPCQLCKKMWGVSPDKHGGNSDPHILLERLGTAITVFDIRRWDGTDFMGENHGGWITRRALDWLLSIHAAPFRAEPVPVNVAGLSKAELARLEEVRKPLPNVSPPALEKFTKRPEM